MCYLTESIGIKMLLLAISAVLAASLAEAKLVQTLPDRPSFEIVKKNPGGVAVFFGKINIGNSDSLELRNFMKSYEMAAISLKDYGVEFFQVDCMKNSDEMKKECENGRGKVIFYSKEGNSDEFELQLLFDEDHIVAHALHFILQRDVEITQDKFNWDRIIMEKKGKKDVILAYVRGIGDKEHRYFMEAAFVYGKEYQFVLTTEGSMPGVVNSGALWYYHCRKANSAEDCKVVTKQQQPNSVLDVVRFLKLQGLKRIVEMEKDGLSPYDHMEVTFPINKVYLFDNGLDFIQSLAEECVEKVDPSFYFILVDKDIHREHLRTFGLDDDTILPTLAFQPAHLIGSQEKYYEQWLLDQDFSAENMINMLNEFNKSPHKHYSKLIDTLNIDEYSIEDWKKPSQGLSVVGGCMKEMDACIAYRIVFRRLARSLSHSWIDKDFTIAYVDFSGRPDDAKLNTLPGLMIIKNGKEIKHTGEMDFDSLVMFLRKNFSPKVRYLPLSGSDHYVLPSIHDAEGNPLATEEEGEEEEEEEADQAALLKMEDDDMSKLAVDRIKKGIKDENVTSLTEMTFNATRDENELMVTLFYLQWCVKSIMFRETYAKVVDKLEESKSERSVKISVNKVNCFNWEDLCKKEKIIRYPIIKIYRKGMQPFTYSGAFHVEALLQTIELLQGPVVAKLKDDESLKRFTGVGEKVTQETPASVLGIFKSEDDSELTTFRSVAKEMFGKYSFAYVAGAVAKQSAEMMKTGLPSFMVLKRNDPAQNMVKSGDFGHMKEFVEQHSLPSFGEMTALNFPKYNMFGKPYIIQFRQPNDTSMDASLTALASKTQAVFVTWMDMSKTVTLDIMDNYLTNKVDPALVMVSHKQGKVYRYNKDGDVDKLLKWTEDCLANKVDPIVVLENAEWKPLREGYNYLEMIKEREQMGKQDTMIQEVENTTPGEETDDDMSNFNGKEKPTRDEL